MVSELNSDALEPPSADESPTVHEAELAPGASGGVYRGFEFDVEAAIARRQIGGNVVVCGNDLKANRRLAEKIEAAVGPYVRSAPHRISAGPRALPHFQQQNPDHEGHCFYETPKQKALRRKA